jgi:hypothetical protein
MAIDPSANAGFMIAAYVVTGAILMGYGAYLWFRARRRPSRG